jgi:hypothetical protein
MGNKKIVYPVYEKLLKDTEEMVGNNRLFSVEQIRNIITNVVVEYEHGTADVKDVDNVNIKQYASVAHDLLLCIEHHYEPGDEE